MTSARVLVVEDEPVLRESVAASLEAAGFVVHAAADGRDLDAVVGRFRRTPPSSTSPCPARTA